MDIPDPEDNPTGGWFPNYETIPHGRRRLINEMCFEEWGIDTPREFQVQAIHRGAFYDDSYQMIVAKTGYGKSLIPLGIAAMRRGVSIIRSSLLYCCD